MKYGILLKRYKRFLADVKLESGETITAHCPNSGRMTGCATSGWKVALSESSNPKRKYKYTLEFVHNGLTWIGVHAAGANKIALEAIEKGLIPSLADYETYRREVPYGEKSRVDILGEGEKEKCYIEVKSCTLVLDDGHYAFPDAPTERGRKHIAELLAMVEQGHRAVLLFIVQREDGKGFVPAREIDPSYAAALDEALQKGLEVLCYQCRVSPERVEVVSEITYEGW